MGPVYFQPLHGAPFVWCWHQKKCLGANGVHLQATMHNQHCQWSGSQTVLLSWRRVNEWSMGNQWQCDAKLSKTSCWIYQILHLKAVSPTGSRDDIKPFSYNIYYQQHLHYQIHMEMNLHAWKWLPLNGTSPFAVEANTLFNVDHLLKMGQTFIFLCGLSSLIMCSSAMRDSTGKLRMYKSSFTRKEPQVLVAPSDQITQHQLMDRTCCARDTLRRRQQHCSFCVKAHFRPETGTILLFSWLKSSSTDNVNCSPLDSSFTFQDVLHWTLSSHNSDQQVWFREFIRTDFHQSGAVGTCSDHANNDSSNFTCSFDVQNQHKCSNDPQL